MGDASSWASVVISALSLFVSVIAVWKSSRAQREANDTQKRVVEIEEQRDRERRERACQADLRPQLRRSDELWRLYLINRGQAEARNVRVTLDGEPLHEHPVGTMGGMPTQVGPNSEVSCVLIFGLGIPGPPFSIEIKWDDDFGTDRTYRGTLTF